MTIIYQHFINGEHIAGSSTDFFDLISPVTGEVYARSPNANEADVNAAYAAAKAREVLGCIPERVHIGASGSIIKNVKSYKTDLSVL